MKMRTFLHLVIAAAFAASPLFARGDSSSALSVTTVHPLLSDVARQVGGDRVKVIELMPAGANVHHFEPDSGDMTKIRASNVLLASGKGLEFYLPKLQESLKGSSVRLVDVGSEVRSLKVSAASSVFVCCPAHSAGSIDPHWWHSIEGMKKSVAYVAKEFGKADPANAALYKSNAAAYVERLDGLEGWAKRELSKVPRSNRVLVTAHAAFGYFCKDFGFKSLPVAGLSAENTSSKYLAEAIDEIRKNKVVAVFPEKDASDKALEAIISATGVTKGGALIADGSAAGFTTYEAFFRHNIETVVAALAGAARSSS